MVMSSIRQWSRWSDCKFLYFSEKFAFHFILWTIAFFWQATKNRWKFTFRFSKTYPIRIKLVSTVKIVFFFGQFWMCMKHDLSREQIVIYLHLIAFVFVQLNDRRRAAHTQWIWGEKWSLFIIFGIWQLYFYFLFG